MQGWEAVKAMKEGRYVRFYKWHKDNYAWIPNDSKEPLILTIRTIGLDALCIALAQDGWEIHGDSPENPEPAPERKYRECLAMVVADVWNAKEHIDEALKKAEAL